MDEYHVTTGKVYSYNQMPFLPLKDFFPLWHRTNFASRYNENIFSVHAPPWWAVKVLQIGGAR